MKMKVRQVMLFRALFYSRLDTTYINRKPISLTHDIEYMQKTKFIYTYENRMLTRII